jgi:peptidyl-prolyl cis-trans isomerase C
MVLRSWLGCIVLCLAIVSCGRQESVAKREALPLAQVDTELITERDLEYLVDNVAESAKSEQEGSAKIREYLHALIDRALILKEARGGGLDQNLALRNEVALALRRRLIREVEKRNIEAQVNVTEEDMKRIFVEQNWERWIKIAHIIVPTQERAEEAMAALRTGRPFEEIAREFSIHPRTASLGGVKPQYYSRFHAQPLVRDVLFSLAVGEISEPMVVAQGYEIFKVLDESQATYEQTEEFLFKTLSKDWLEARRKAYTDSLARQFQLTPDPQGLGILMGILRSGREDEATDKKTFQIPEGAAETPLFRYEGGQIGLGEAVLLSPNIRQGRNVSDSAGVAHFLELDVVMPQLMWLEADKLEIDRELEEWVKRKEEEVLIVTMRRIATSTDEQISEQEVLDYYEATKEHYRTSSEVSVVEIQLASKVDADALLSEIRALFGRAQPLIDLLARMGQERATGPEMDADLEVLEWLRRRLDERDGVETILEEIDRAASPKELAEEYIMRQLVATHSLRPGSSETEGHYHLYWYETARFGALVAAAMEGEIGSLIGPLQIGPSYSIAKILNRKESKARPYEERASQLRTNIRKERESELFGRWLRDLRASYEDEVRYFDENIEKLGRELAAEGRGQAARVRK